MTHASCMPILILSIWLSIVFCLPCTLLAQAPMEVSIQVNHPDQTGAAQMFVQPSGGTSPYDIYYYDITGKTDEEITTLFENYSVSCEKSPQGTVDLTIDQINYDRELSSELRDRNFYLIITDATGDRLDADVMISYSLDGSYNTTVTVITEDQAVPANDDFLIINENAVVIEDEHDIAIQEDDDLLSSKVIGIKTEGNNKVSKITGSATASDLQNNIGEYILLCPVNGSLKLLQSGQTETTLTTYAPDDYLRLTWHSNEVQVWKNDQLLFTTPFSSTETIYQFSVEKYFVNQ